VALLVTERGDGTEEALEATLLVLALLPLELSVLDWTFFSVDVGDALTPGFLAKSAPVLSIADVFFSAAGFEPTAGADTSLVFFAPSDSVGLGFLATAELPLSSCFPAVPVLLLLGTEPAFSDGEGFIKEDRDTPTSAGAAPSVRFLMDEAVPKANLPVGATGRGFTGLASAGLEASDGVSIPLQQHWEPQDVHPNPS
jgi:hypothetical protein